MNINELKVYIEKNFGNAITAISIQNTNELLVEVLNESVMQLCQHANKKFEFPLISMFANDERSIIGKYAIYYVFADRSNNIFLILKTQIDAEDATFNSLADEIYTADGYEREINDMFGIEPVGHSHHKRLVFHGNWPDGLYPLRKDFDRTFKPPFEKNPTEFTRVEGDGIFEIPVGPVHAGIIEPGHFRFSVAGEPIINLEAQLYYVHKGIEKMCEGISVEKCCYVSERISGDESFTNSLAFCSAIERIAGIKVPERANLERVIFAELERLTSHLGDLAGVCIDVAYGFAAFQFRMLRGWAYLLADELCGMRFLRSVNKPGGIRKDFVKGKEVKIIDSLEKIKKEIMDTSEIIKANALFIDRVENTGVLDKKVAIDLNAVGPVGRASGIWQDVRKDFPYAAYDKLEFFVPEHGNGDVNCRVHVRIEECLQSIRIILNAVEILKEGKIEEPIGKLEPYKCALGFTESPRGENIHYVMVGENNTIFRYKIRTPSFCNWPVLCHAVNGNIVPDFPLINKSFNLSYAGNDL